MDVTPKVGMMFKHSVWQYTNGDPQVCKITRIAKGTLYYRDVNRFRAGDRWFAGDKLGGSWKFDVKDFAKYCMEVVDGDSWQ